MRSAAREGLQLGATAPVVDFEEEVIDRPPPWHPDGAPSAGDLPPGLRPAPMRKGHDQFFSCSTPREGPPAERLRRTVPVGLRRTPDFHRPPFPSGGWEYVFVWRELPGGQLRACRLPPIGSSCLRNGDETILTAVKADSPPLTVDIGLVCALFLGKDVVAVSTFGHRASISPLSREQAFPITLATDRPIALGPPVAHLYGGRTDLDYQCRQRQQRRLVRSSPGRRGYPLHLPQCAEILPPRQQSYSNCSTGDRSQSGAGDLSHGDSVLIRQLTPAEDRTNVRSSGQ